MDATKYAWQILHAMIRRRVAADEGHMTSIRSLRESVPCGALLQTTRASPNSRWFWNWRAFGALFAEMTGNDTLAMAADIGRDVMAQPDEEDED